MFRPIGTHQYSQKHDVCKGFGTENAMQSPYEHSLVGRQLVAGATHRVTVAHHPRDHAHQDSFWTVLIYWTFRMKKIVRQYYKDKNPRMQEVLKKLVLSTQL